MAALVGGSISIPRPPSTHGAVRTQEAEVPLCVDGSHLPNKGEGHTLQSPWRQTARLQSPAPVTPLTGFG